MNKHILLVDLIKSILKVIGYTFICLVFFTLAMNVACVSAKETSSESPYFYTNNFKPHYCGFTDTKDRN